MYLRYGVVSQAANCDEGCCNSLDLADVRNQLRDQVKAAESDVLVFC
jgi:hypothetical protein